MAGVSDLSLFTWFRWLGSQICRDLRGSGGRGLRFVGIYVICRYLRGSDALGHRFVVIYMVPVAWVPDLSLFTWFWCLRSQICRYLRDSGGLGHRLVAISVVPVWWVTDLSVFTNFTWFRWLA